MSLCVQAVSVDAHDPLTLGRWWAELLGWRVTYVDDEGEEVVLEPPAGSPEDGVVADLLFVKVPDDKVLKNRVHLDLRPEDHGAEVARAEALGAVRVDIGQGPDHTWVVLADPEGNEFCILRNYTAEELAQWAAEEAATAPESG